MHAPHARGKFLERAQREWLEHRDRDEDPHLAFHRDRGVVGAAEDRPRSCGEQGRQQARNDEGVGGADQRDEQRTGDRTCRHRDRRVQLQGSEHGTAHGHRDGALEERDPRYLEHGLADAAGRQGCEGDGNHRQQTRHSQCAVTRPVSMLSSRLRLLERDLRLTLFTNIKRPKAAHLVGQQIRDAIIAARIRTGDRLPPERELIEQFGYSRAVIREALRMLEQEGLITLQAGRNGGAKVVWPGTDRLAAQLDVLLRLQDTTFEDLFTGRQILELVIVDLACMNATPADIANLRANVEATAKQSADQAAGRAYNSIFHRVMSEATHNNLVAVVGRMVQDLVHSVAIDRAPTDVLAAAHAHSRIIDAIEARDREAAARRMLRHLKFVEEGARRHRELQGMSRGYIPQSRAVTTSDEP